MPEHKEYYENLRKTEEISRAFWDRLQYELAPTKLSYFYQFKERIHVTRIHAYYKKSEADYCIHYAKQFYAETQPWNISRNQKWYDERLSTCDDKYNTFCIKINKLESSINENFLFYYSLENPAYKTSRMIYDHGLVQFANGNLEKAVGLAEEFLNQINKENKNLKSFSSEQLLNLGVTYNEAMEYTKAIESLTASIENDPSNKKAYFQRAIAYLEMGLFDNAANDFLISEFEKSQKNNFKAPDEFRDNFLLGLVEGSEEAVINYFPSLFSFAYVTIAHPVNSLINFTDACHGLMQITKDYLKEVDWSQIEVTTGLSRAIVEPGLKKIYENLDQLSPREQGHLMGHTIGSLGIDFLAGAAVIKGFSNAAVLADACKLVREAGRIYELETLTQSSKAAESIITEASKRVTIRECILQGAKTGQIVIKNPNVQFHIMQKKHAWDKLIILSGNVEEDTRRVVSLLEEHCILSNQYLKDVENVAHNILKKEYEVSIGEQRVRAVFNEYVNEGHVFLNDAWVITK